MRVTESKPTPPTARPSAAAPAAPETPAAKASGDVFAPSGRVRPGDTAPQGLPDISAFPRPMARLGGTDYYQHRAEDFRRRHPDLPVPTYYLGYGDKYVNRFTDELFPKLSPAGKEWLVQARLNLQLAIENELKKDPAAFDRLERDDEAFLEFAYDSHPKAYLDAGLERLPLKDLVRIGLTPDVKDLATLNGLEQVVEVAAGMAAKKARSYLDRGLTWKLPGAKDG